MSVLCDKDIRRLCEGRDDVALVCPFTNDQLQPASYDVALGTTFQRVSRGRVRSLKLGEPASFADLYTREEIDEGEEYTISPKGFVLACTAEKVAIPPYIVAQISGKSTTARSGLIIESAGFVDPGFRGCLTLELFNQLEVQMVVRSGQLVAQLTFTMMTGRAERPYGHEGLRSHYQDSEGTIGSRFDA